MRTSVLAATTLAAGLTLIPVGAAGGDPQMASMWHPLKSYCSPTGDYCYGIQTQGEKVRFRVDAFAQYWDSVNFCVKKKYTRNWVCHSKAVKQGKNDMYVAKIGWQANYPTNGDAKRVVRFFKGTPKLTFQP